jgi:multisubunit Na+/H+ antiporter MnhF subunit
MIFGRPPALILGLLAAVVNVAILVFKIPITLDQLAALDALAVAVIAIVANSATDHAAIAAKRNQE